MVSPRSGPDSTFPSTLTSPSATIVQRTSTPLHSTEPVRTMNKEDEEMRRVKSKYVCERQYFVAKELLNTERTYKKDLEIVNVWFREAVSNSSLVSSLSVFASLFSHLSPLYATHTSFLREVETKMATWEGKTNLPVDIECQKMGDLILRTFDAKTTEHYLSYLEFAPDLLLLLLALNRRVNQMTDEGHIEDEEAVVVNHVMTDFERHKVCYLPLATLILRPLHRLLHYELLLERLLRSYELGHADRPGTHMALIKLQTLVRRLTPVLESAEHSLKLLELQTELGVDLANGSKFVMEGSLFKLARKGFQQRIFFLFEDVLLYANRSSSSSSSALFRVHNQLRVSELEVNEAEPRGHGFDHCFVLNNKKRGSNSSLVLCANSAEEKRMWMHGLSEAIRSSLARDQQHGQQTPLLSLRSIAGSEEALAPVPVPATSSSRPNSSVHVCWHRLGTSLSSEDWHVFLQTVLSGYLLRKFKNSDGWQKLWVVFSNASLYFFKTFEDDAPLASLPLLGYSTSLPEEGDAIGKECVFKLCFKNHVYFFRAESKHTFNRWIEALGTVTRLSEPLLIPADLSTLMSPQSVLGANVDQQ